jgi:hypothetical protein
MILWYLNACASGKLELSECGPVWQMLIIVIFLVAAVAALVVIRLRPRAQPQQS